MTRSVDRSVDSDNYLSESEVDDGNCEISNCSSSEDDALEKTRHEKKRKIRGAFSEDDSDIEIKNQQSNKKIKMLRPKINNINKKNENRGRNSFSKHQKVHSSNWEIIRCRDLAKTSCVNTYTKEIQVPSKNCSCLQMTLKRRNRQDINLAVHFDSQLVSATDNEVIVATK